MVQSHDQVKLCHVACVMSMPSCRHQNFEFHANVTVEYRFIESLIPIANGLGQQVSRFPGPLLSSSGPIPSVSTDEVRSILPIFWELLYWLAPTPLPGLRYRYRSSRAPSTTPVRLAIRAVRPPPLSAAGPLFSLSVARTPHRPRPSVSNYRRRIIQVILSWTAPRYCPGWGAIPSSVGSGRRRE